VLNGRRIVSRQNRRGKLSMCPAWIPAPAWSPAWIPAFAGMTRAGAGATVLFVKHGILLVGRNMVPSLLVAHHGIQDDEQFSHARSQSDLFLFASI